MLFPSFVIFLFCENLQFPKPNYSRFVYLNIKNCAFTILY